MKKEAELSLKFVESCLEPVDIECDSLLSDPQTKRFLKEKQVIWKKSEKQFLKALNEKKEVIQGFLKEFESREAGERKLVGLKERIATKQEDYNKAEASFNEAQKSYDEQNNNIDGIERAITVTEIQSASVDAASRPPMGVTIWASLFKGNELQFLGNCAWRASPSNGVDQVCVKMKESLKTKEQQQRQALEEAKNNLVNKNLDKTTKEGIKNHLQVELEKDRLVENDLESRLNKWMQEEKDLEKLENNLNMLHRQTVYMELMLKQLQTDEIQEDFKNYGKIDFFDEAKIIDLMKEFNIEPDYKFEL